MRKNSILDVSYVLACAAGMMVATESPKQKPRVSYSRTVGREMHGVRGML